MARGGPPAHDSAAPARRRRRGPPDDPVARLANPDELPHLATRRYLRERRLSDQETVRSARSPGRSATPEPALRGLPARASDTFSTDPNQIGSTVPPRRVTATTYDRATRSDRAQTLRGAARQHAGRAALPVAIAKCERRGREPRRDRSKATARAPALPPRRPGRRRRADPRSRAALPRAPRDRSSLDASSSSGPPAQLEEADACDSLHDAGRRSIPGSLHRRGRPTTSSRTGAFVDRGRRRRRSARRLLPR